MSHSYDPGQSSDRNDPSRGNPPAPNSHHQNLSRLPANSPAEALEKFNQERASLLANLAEPPTRPSIIDKDLEDSLPALPPKRRLEIQIEAYAEMGGGQAVIHLDNRDSITIKILRGSDPKALADRIIEITNGDTENVSIESGLPAVEQRYQELNEWLCPEKLSSADEIRARADECSLRSAASTAELAAMVQAYFNLLPDDPGSLSDTGIGNVVKVCEELATNEHPDISSPALSFISRVKGYKPTWRVVMTPEQRCEMEAAQGSFKSLSNQEWNEINAASELIALGRKYGNVEELICLYCKAIIPEFGLAAYKDVLDPLFVSSLPELTEQQLLVVAKGIDKAKERINRLYILSVPLRGSEED